MHHEAAEHANLRMARPNSNSTSLLFNHTVKVMSMLQLYSNIFEWNIK